jgi:hypothetical protein
MSDFLTRRNGTWHFVRRVPVESVESGESGESRHERGGPKSGPTPVSFYPVAESIERFFEDALNARSDRCSPAKSSAVVVTEVSRR